MIRLRGWWALPLLVSLAGCEGSAPSDIMVTDSAGVRLTVSEDAGRVFTVLLGPHDLARRPGRDRTDPVLQDSGDTTLDHEVRPDVLPGYDRVLLSANGEVWAQVYESDIGAPHDWDVFDAEGRFVGTARVAAGVYPLVVPENAVVGVWRDSLGVEHVQAYGFTRP